MQIFFPVNFYLRPVQRTAECRATKSQSR